MCDQSTTCNPHWHTQQRQSTKRGWIGRHLTLNIMILLQIDDVQCFTQTHTPVKKRAPLITRSSRLRFVSAAEHHSTERYSNTGRTKPQSKASPRSNLSRNTLQDFLEMPSLWKATLETELRCLTKIIFELNVTPNISRSSDTCSTPIINWGDW